MNYLQLVNSISEKSALDEIQVKAALEALASTFAECYAKSEPIVWPQMGTFHARHVPERYGPVGRSLNTHRVAGYSSYHFSAGETLKTTVRRIKEAQSETSE